CRPIRPSAPVMKTRFGIAGWLADSVTPAILRPDANATYSGGDRVRDRRGRVPARRPVVRPDVRRSGHWSPRSGASGGGARLDRGLLPAGGPPPPPRPPAARP